MPKLPWWENDELAKSLTKLGRIWEIKVGQRLNQYGVAARMVGEYSWRSSHADIPKYKNQLDLVVVVPGSGAPLILEVKSRRFSFSDLPQSWPRKLYNLPDGIVDLETVPSLEGKAVAPHIYVFISRKTNGIVAVPGNISHQYFIINDVHDSLRDTTDDWWCTYTHNLRGFKWLIGALGGTYE